MPSAGPHIDQVLTAIHDAFSLAVGQTFWIGVVGSIAAVVAAVAIKEIPLRHTNEAPVPTEAIGASAGNKSSTPETVSASVGD